jgi:uncharacterized protein YggE
MTNSVFLRYITVNGVGTSSVSPDAVRLFLLISVLAKTNKDALSNASKSANAVRTALKTATIDSKDITTSSLTVYPDYNYSQDKGQQLVGYRATQSFTVVIRKVENTGAIIDTTVRAGGNSLQVNGVSPFLINGAAATEKAREAAVADAMSRAKSYAKSLGTSLDEIMFLTETNAPSYAFPFISTDKTESLNPTQVDLGQTEVTVTVLTQWKLKDSKSK